MPAPKKTPDRHYDFERTNFWFAWSAIALLATTVWMVFEDYAKPWKRLQSEFRELERQSLRQQAEEERRRLNEEEIAAIRAEIETEEQRLAEQRDEIEELEDQFAALDSEVYEADSNARKTKSLLDTARWEYDEALQRDDPDRQAGRHAELLELRRQYREQRMTLEGFTEQRDMVRQQLESKRSGLDGARDRLATLRGGLETLEQRVANLDKEIDYLVLNAPLMDFLEPDLKIDQVILSGLYQDINFTAVDRVDRCTTCHVAATRAGFEGEEWEEPFRSHPRLDLFLSSSSPHPYNRFGCTTCHGGLDRATDFARVGHSPRSEEQRHEWEREWGWEPQKYLETPILPAQYSEAGCISCHAGNLWTPGSELQDSGRELMSRMGCYACHKIDYPAFTDLPRPGPSLLKVAAKTTPGWAYKWIESPRDFHPTTWMPHFFFQPNIVGDLNQERQRAEIRSLVAYIWDRSEEVDYPDPPAGDAGRGEQLFDTVGCTGCHIRDGEAVRDDFFPQINRLHGPNLVRTGSKVDPGWLFAWLKDPQEYNPETRMPSLRLTDREAADLVAFLMSSRDPAYEDLELPAVDPQVRDGLVLDYLQNNNTIEQSEAKLAEMSDGERDVFLGEETIRKYGCFGCHNVVGFEDDKPIGVELTEEGSKPVHQFDFGHVHDVPHTRHDWIRTKLLQPRLWDHGREQVKDYNELYKMPHFGMSEREAEAIVANVLGFTTEQVRTARKADQGAEDPALAEGRKLITRFNCRGCHLLEGEGQAIRTSIEDPGLLPPNLAAEGARVQADWLFGYLHDPGTVEMRPWLTVRMPTFGLTDEQVNSVIAYFTARDGREPFLSRPGRAGARSLAVGRGVYTMLQCAKCHPSGPAQPGDTVNVGELAPSLLLAQERLRHDWVSDWIKDPQSWVTGTRMPVFFSRTESGHYESPLGFGIDAPPWSGVKSRMLGHFESEAELKEYLADADLVTTALRDHIWWNLEGGP